MILKDYECQECGNISEVFITGIAPKAGICPDCKGKTVKIVSMSQTSPVDPGWLNSTLSVVDKHNPEPHCTEFLKHPTRANYKNWMKGEGLRHLETGEKPPKIDKKARRKRVNKHLLEKHMERNAVAI